MSLLILSEEIDQTINKVIDYLYYFDDRSFVRINTEDPINEYSKPLKCGYDPYTGEWSEWSKNPLKKKAIEYYGMEEMLEEDKRRK